MRRLNELNKLLQDQRAQVLYEESLAFESKANEKLKNSEDDDAIENFYRAVYLQKQVDLLAQLKEVVNVLVLDF